MQLIIIAVTGNNRSQKLLSAFYFCSLEHCNRNIYIAKLRKANCQVVVLATIIRETVGALKEKKKIGWEDEDGSFND